MAPSTSDAREGPPALTLTDRELFHRLGWFTHVRWVFGLFCLLVLLIAWHGVGVRFCIGAGPPSAWPAVHIVLMLFLYNAVFTFVVHVVRAKGGASRRMVMAVGVAQLTCDLMAVFALIHRTGGVENIFLVLILLPVVIVSELLPLAWAYVGATVAAGLLHVLAWGEQQGWLPHATIELTGRGVYGAGLYRDPYYVLLVTVAMTVALFAMVFITTTIAARLRRREDQLEDAYRQLRRADEVKGFFMRRAEHEMRAPLAAIHSLLEVIALKLGGPSAEAIRLIERAKIRTKDLISLVKDLRRYSQLQVAEMIVPAEPLLLHELVTGTVDLYRKQAEAQSVDLDLHAEPTRITGNPEMLRELVTNLVANALQYTLPGGRIEVSLRPVDRWAELRVADTGIGLSDKAKESLFQEFFRAKEARQIFPDGTGLGLSIVQRIVVHHGGRIAATNGPRHGAVFTVHLPLFPPGAEVAKRTQDKKTPH